MSGCFINGCLSVKITTLLNEDLLQHTLLCLCNCLGYDIRYTTILSWTIKQIVAIFCEYPGEDKEKSSDDVKRHISLGKYVLNFEYISIATKISLQEKIKVPISVRQEILFHKKYFNMDALVYICYYKIKFINLNSFNLLLFE